MSDLPRYLTDLEDALDDLPDDADAMLLSEIDGYVTGIALLPVEVPATEWLPAIWRPNPDTPDYLYHDQALLDAIAELATRHFRAVARDLHHDEYAPIYDVDGRNDDILWEFWMEGLDRAFRLRPEAFEGAEADEEAFGALTGLVALAIVAAGEADMDAGSEDTDGAAGSPLDAAEDADLSSPLTEEEKREVTEQAPDLIPMFVSILYDWTRSIRPVPDFAVPARSAKIGRNDPCPCGSGKKYKKCCGAAA